MELVSGEAKVARYIRPLNFNFEWACHLRSLQLQQKVNSKIKMNSFPKRRAQLLIYLFLSYYLKNTQLEKSNEQVFQSWSL